VTEENQRTAIEQEMRHSEAAMRAAHALRGLDLHNDALSRLYYALFHGTTALLLTEGIEPRRHRTISKLLGTRFVTTGALTAEDIAIVSRAQTYRDLADYERAWEPTGAIVDAAFAEVEPLLTRIRRILEQGGWLRLSA